MIKRTEKLMLNKHNDNYWDFKDIKASGIHKIAKYPAVMVAPMQYEILSSLVKENESYKTMLDPFHGSGVTLVEGGSAGLEVYGIDINPYAHLIAKVKLNKLDFNYVRSRNIELKSKIQSLAPTGYEKHHFCNISKWFRSDVIDDLSKIRHTIKSEPDAQTRHYYWLCFGETVRVHSNTRSSTFKLHAKQDDKVEAMENNVIQDFLGRINLNYEFLNSRAQSMLYCDDSIKKMASFNDSFFDIICTSPPYGDNSTTVTYGQFSSLQLHWIDIEDVGCSTSWLENFSKIDSASMGGAYSISTMSKNYLSLNRFIKRITAKKQQKIYRFVADYEAAFCEMVRVLRPGGSMVLTLANRRVDNAEFPLVDITKELALYHDLKLKHVLNRRIQNKRMPYKVSCVDKHGAVSSMSKENVLMFLK